MPAIAAGAAAVIAAIAIMLKGGMIQKPKALGGPGGAGGDAGGAPQLGGDDQEEDPFKRYPRARDAGGYGPTQAETTVLDPSGTWGEPEGDTSVTYQSPGDGDGMTSGGITAQQAAAVSKFQPGGEYNPSGAVGTSAQKVAIATLLAQPAPTTAETTTGTTIKVGGGF